MADEKSQYHQENGVTLIEIRLHSIQQLFNSLDPSPFYEKDLDHEAEVYIDEAAREFPISASLKLVFYVQPEEMNAAPDVEGAIHNYFDNRLRIERAALRRKLAYGRVTLAIALVFLFICIALREVVLKPEESTIHEIIAEGLLISGWVAMWEPIHVFLYDWWPLWRNCRHYEKLARLPVELRPRQN